MDKKNFNSFLKNLELTAEQICGNPMSIGDITEVTNGFLYDNSGKRTDTVITQNYETVFPDNSYLIVTVKVKGDKPILTNDQIKQKGKKANVSFKNLTGKIYYSYKDNSYALSCNADGIEVIQ